MLAQPKVLLLSSDATETRKLKQILEEHALLRSVMDLAGLRSYLDGDAYDALFCGWSFHRGTWNDALEHVKQRCPDLPVVIFCRLGGEQEWVKALEAGAFDLLVAPYQPRTVRAVLEQAVASYQARRLHHGPPCSEAAAV